MQGALRSAFLIRSGLSKEQFVGTGVIIAFLIDVSRPGVYVPTVMTTAARIDYPLLQRLWCLHSSARAWAIDILRRSPWSMSRVSLRPFSALSAWPSLQDGFN